MLRRGALKRELLKNGLLNMLASGMQQKSARFKIILGPLLLILLIFAIGLIIMSSFRALLTLFYWERLLNTPHVLWLFPIGLRMDVIIMCYLLALPVILIFLMPKELVLKWRKFFICWSVAVVLLLLYMEIATFQFVEEYDLRPDRKFFEYLGHPKEVFGTLWTAYKTQLIFCCIVLVTIGILIAKLTDKVIRSYSAWNWRVRLLVFPFVVGIFVIGARSTLGHRPVNLSTAYFSNNHLANEFALNSTYTLLYALYRDLYHEKNPSTLYGKLSEADAIKHLRPLVEQPENTYFEGDIPFLHEQKSPFKYDRPANIVVVLLESVGAVDTGCLDGPDITPNLCRLKDEGLWFSNLYATGTRTVRGIEAVVSGFLPTANRSVVKLNLAKNDFFTIAELLKKHNYETEFIYGGVSNFDEMRSFFMGNGFDNIYDEPTFKDPVFSTTWGVSDEDLFRRANEIFKAHGDQPFFSLILTTSNHVPYEYPDGRIELYEQPKETHRNAVKYADYALGLFFELAKKEPYYDNTIFIVVADHNSHVVGNDLVPIDKFHVPAFIIGPNVPKKTVTLLSSQIDLMPTALHFSGLDTIHPMIGRNVMTLPKGAIGRAMMQFAENAAYQEGDQVIIMRPFVTPLQFQLHDSSLVPTTLDPEMLKDAMSYAYLPWYLYSQKLYRID